MSNCLIPGVNDLATKAPELAEQWDYEKNGDLTPQMVSYGTSRKVWWRCTLGHSWKAGVNWRNGGNGCPICAGQRVLTGFNDLASKNPQLAIEWNYNKNGDLSPQMVTSSSGRKVWWQCPLGHSWKATVNNRNNGTGCPVCTGKQVLIGFNDLASQNPQLAAEWDYDRNGDLTPQTVTVGSNRHVWWKCSLGHGWMADINSRGRGTGCPICSNKQVLIGFNDLVSQNPRIASEWDYDKNGDLTPQMVTPSSERRAWWRCSFGHSWKATVDARSRGSGCPVCVGKQVVVGFNDLASENPQLAAQWDSEKNNGLTPQMVTPGVHRQVWWLCSLGHSWKAAVHARSKGTGCPICAGKQVLVGFNDLSSQNPQLAAQWDYDKNEGITPQMITPSSFRYAWWKCNLGHSWRAKVSDRNQGTGCPVCAGKQILAGFNDLASQNPELAEQWDYDRNNNLTPQMVAPRAHRQVWWRCSLGHSWKANVYDRSEGCGCPVCAGQQVLVGFNDLASQNPQLAAQWDQDRNGSLTPQMVTPWAHRQIWWQCSLGHSWKATVNSRGNGNGCPVCLGKRNYRRRLVP